MRCSTPSLLCTGLLLSAVLAGPSVPDVPFALPERSPGSDEERFFHALRVRVLFAEGLFEQGKAEAAERQLALVGKTLLETKDGYIFNSGNQIGEEKLEPARTPNGFRYGAKRQGHRGKSDTLSTLARYFCPEPAGGSERGDSAHSLVFPATPVCGRISLEPRESRAPGRSDRLS